MSAPSTLSLSLIIISFFRSEEANKCFSAAVQLHDGLYKAWALWGDFLDQLFAVDKLVHDLFIHVLQFYQYLDFKILLVFGIFCLF